MDSAASHSAAETRSSWNRSRGSRSRVTFPRSSRRCSRFVRTTVRNRRRTLHRIWRRLRFRRAASTHSSGGQPRCASRARDAGEVRGFRYSRRPGKASALRAASRGAARALEAFAETNFRTGTPLVVSPATSDAAVARAWLAGDAARLDGVIAKRLDLAYDFGGRDAVVKIKRRYTADCVVGGFRRTE